MVSSRHTYNILHGDIVSTEPLPPPSNVRLTYLSASEGVLIFKWDAVMSSCEVLYNIMAKNCGTCPKTTNSTSVMCTTDLKKSRQQSCSFAVQTVICNNITGNITEEVHVILQGNFQCMHIIRHAVLDHGIRFFCSTGCPCFC